MKPRPIDESWEVSQDAVPVKSVEDMTTAEIIALARSQNKGRPRAAKKSDKSHILLGQTTISDILAAARAQGGYKPKPVKPIATKSVGNLTTSEIIAVARSQGAYKPQAQPVRVQGKYLTTSEIVAAARAQGGQKPC
jgi:curli biogenesis system outer membrane secretion channel CsgG